MSPSRWNTRRPRGRASVVVVFFVTAVVLHGQAPGQDPAKRWNEIFTSTAGETFLPNAFLASVIEGRKPGTALDIAMGEGRNALLLAARGWKVTGFDISEVAVKRAREAAEARSVSLEAVTADVSTFDYGTERWDLVAAIYIHGLLTVKPEAVVRSLKPGGILVVEGFHRDALPAAGYRTNELLTIFGGLTVLQYEDVVGRPDPTWADREPFRFVRLVARKEPANWR
jgi:SAM-dependent methyltransferase